LIRKDIHRGKLSDTDNRITSEIPAIQQRNKLLKIADRHRSDGQRVFWQSSCWWYWGCWEIASNYQQSIQET